MAKQWKPMLDLVASLDQAKEADFDADLISRLVADASGVPSHGSLKTLAKDIQATAQLVADSPEFVAANSDSDYPKLLRRTQFSLIALIRARALTAAASAVSGEQSDSDALFEIGRLADAAATSAAQAKLAELLGKKILLSRGKAVSDLLTRFRQDLLDAQAQKADTAESEIKSRLGQIKKASEKFEKAQRAAAKKEAKAEAERKKAEEEAAKAAKAEERLAEFEERVERNRVVREAALANNRESAATLAVSGFELAYRIGSIPTLRFDSESQISHPGTLSELSPNGSRVISFAIEPVTVEQARDFAALLAAGRDISLVTVSPLADDVAEWLSPAAQAQVMLAPAGGTSVPDWVPALVAEGLDSGYAFAIAAIATAQGFSDYEVKSCSVLAELRPAGPPVVLYSAEPLAVESARTIAALVASGRAVALVSEHDIPAASREWLPASVVTASVPLKLFGLVVSTGVPTGPGIDTVLSDADPRFSQWMTDFLERYRSSGMKRFFDDMGEEDEEPCSEYSGWSASFFHRNRSYILPFQGVGEVMAMEFLNASLDETTEELTRWINDFAEQAGDAYLGCEPFFANSAVLLHMRTPFGAHAIIRVTRNHDFVSSTSVFRFGVCVGYVTDPQVFDFDNLELRAATWPAAMALSNSWPMSLLGSRQIMTGPMLMRLGDVDHRFAIERWMSVEPGMADGSNNFHQWVGENRLPIGRLPKGENPLAVWCGFELHGSDLTGSVLFGMTGLSTLLGVVDGIHMNLRICDELGLIPFALPDAEHAEPVVKVEGQSFIVPSEVKEEMLSDLRDGGSSGRIGGGSSSGKIGGNSSSGRIGDGKKKGL